MDKIIKETERLFGLFNDSIDNFAKNIENYNDLAQFKKDIIRIEGSIIDRVEDMKVLIIKDDRIASEQRESYLHDILLKMNIDVSKLRSNRLTAVAAAKEYIERRKSEAKNNKERLIGDVLLQNNKNMSQTPENIGSEITNRLERTRSLIQEQIHTSTQSVDLIKDSTALLVSVSDKTQEVNSIQNRAKNALKRYQIAQNWDRWLLKASIYFFAFACAFVIIKRIKNNLITRVLLGGAKLTWKTLFTKKLPESIEKTKLTTFSESPLPSPSLQINNESSNNSFLEDTIISSEITT